MPVLSVAPPAIGGLGAPHVVVVAASAGGLRALQTLLAGLSADFPASIVIVQHRAAARTSLLEHILARRSRLPVKTAEEGEAMQPGIVYVARPDYHLFFADDGRFGYRDGTRIRGVLSSANPLFNSAARVFQSGVIAVVLTGTGDDGAEGAQAVKANGGIVIAQDAATAEYFGMPGAAIQAGAVDRVLPLGAIAPALVELVQVRSARH